MSELPTLRWGIVAAGWISTTFVKDLELQRSDARANHIVSAVATASSEERAQKFIDDYVSNPDAKAYGNYKSVNEDPNVDIVYIGSLHIFHKQIALDAIAAGKHVLCEKPLTLNAKDAQILVDAARAKGVFFMEAVWTRFFPIVQEIKKLIHEDKVLGDISRLFVDFGLEVDVDDSPEGDRLKDNKLGGGAILDIGIYSLTWARLLMDDKVGSKALSPQIVASQTLKQNVDVMSSMILTYPEIKAQAIITCSLCTESSSRFLRLEGSKGTLYVEGIFAARPDKYILELKGQEPIEKEFEIDGKGLIYEADQVAVDISNGLTEDPTMPLDETLSVMKILDFVRQQGGLVYPDFE